MKTLLVVQPVTGQLKVLRFWFNPHGSTPDLYTYFPGYCVGVSSVNNPQGFQMPKSGNAYSGIHTFLKQSITREYFSQRLVDTLVSGKCYYAEMFVSLANRACYATNRFGFYFTDDTSGYSLLTALFLLLLRLILRVLYFQILQIGLK